MVLERGIIENKELRGRKMSEEREEDSPVYVTRIVRDKMGVESLLSFLGCTFECVQRIPESTSIIIYLVSQCGVDYERIEYEIFDHEYKKLKKISEENRSMSLVQDLALQIDTALEKEERQFRKIERRNQEA